MAILTDEPYKPDYDSNIVVMTRAAFDEAIDNARNPAFETGKLIGFQNGFFEAESKAKPAHEVVNDITRRLTANLESLLEQKRTREQIAA